MTKPLVTSDGRIWTRHPQLGWIDHGVIAEPVDRSPAERNRSGAKCLSGLGRLVGAIRRPRTIRRDGLTEAQLKMRAEMHATATPYKVDRGLHRRTIRSD